MWFFRWSLRWKLRSQRGHWCWRSVVCISWCRTNLNREENALWQRVHEKGRSPVWEYECCFNFPGLRNTFLQISHAYTLPLPLGLDLGLLRWGDKLTTSSCSESLDSSEESTSTFNLESGLPLGDCCCCCCKPFLGTVFLPDVEGTGVTGSPLRLLPFLPCLPRLLTASLLGVSVVLTQRWLVKLAALLKTTSHPRQRNLWRVRNCHETPSSEKDRYFFKFYTKFVIILWHNESKVFNDNKYEFICWTLPTTRS